MRVFYNDDGVTQSPLWDLTWKRVNQFLPNLKEELFGKDPSNILVLIFVVEISTQQFLIAPIISSAHNSSTARDTINGATITTANTKFSSPFEYFID